MPPAPRSTRHVNGEAACGKPPGGSLIAMMFYVRRAAAAGLGIALLLLGCPATSAGDAAAIVRDWGLLGSWAVDCSRPPGRDNPYLVYAERTDGLVEELDFGDGRDIAEIEAARLEADGKLTLNLGPRPESHRQFRHTTTLTKGPDGRVRSFYAGDTGGNASIRDGIVLTTNEPTPWTARCR